MRCAAVLLDLLTASATLSACSYSSAPGGIDFGRALAPGEYQMSVTGDVQRSFEKVGAAYLQEGTSDRVLLWIWDDTDALNGAAFEVCAPVAGATYAFNTTMEMTGCPNGATAPGGFVAQLGTEPQLDELDCSGNSYGEKNFAGMVTITAITGNEIEGEANGSGKCSRHPHSEITPMGSEEVSIRMRFRAIRDDTP